MHRGDGGLEGVRTRAARFERPSYQRRPFLYLRLVPSRAVLLLERNQDASSGGARGAAGIMQHHEREQTDGFGLGQQVDKQPSQPDRLGREVGAREVALVEDEIDDVQDAGQALGELGK